MDRAEICGNRVELELETHTGSPVTVVIETEQTGRKSILINQDGKDETFMVPNTFEFSLIGELTGNNGTPEEEMGSGSKLDPVLGKLRVDLVPMEAIEAIAQVLGWSGSSKYEDWDWVTRYTVEDCWGSAMRHMMQWKKGERRDPESSQNHLYHALTRLAMAAYLTKKGGPKSPKVGPHGE